jgi:uncharacterized protein with HEPN domain
MRDKVIHEYFGVNLDLVWDVVEQSLPSFRTTVQKMLTHSGGSLKS